MTPAVAVAPIDDALKLSDADKRILSGVVREKYADLIRRLKDHKGLLERDLTDKLRRGEDSWIAPRAKDLLEADLNKRSVKYGEQVKNLWVANDEAEDAVFEAEDNLTDANLAYYAQLKKYLPVVNGDWHRQWDGKSELRLDDASVASVTDIDQVIAKLQKAKKNLAAVDSARQSAHKRLADARKALSKASTAYTAVEIRTKIEYDDEEISLVWEQRKALEKQASKAAEDRADKIAAVVEKLHEDSREFRQELALSRLESADAERIAASIPTSIDDLL